MTTAARGSLAARCRWALLDFDGPVCRAFQGYPAPDVAAALRSIARTKGVLLPTEIERENDPMQVLRGLYGLAPQWHDEFEDALTAAEVQSVAAATPTEGAAAFLEACKGQGIPLAVVSNNSPEAVRAFLERLDLDHLVAAIAGREKSTPELMKPNPYLLRSALSELGGKPAGSMMVGDSTTDIEAAQAIGAMVIGYANRPGKAERWREMKPDLVVSHMGELAEALRAT